MKLVKMWTRKSMRTERSFICVVVAAATLILTRTTTSSQCCDGKTAAVFISAENVSNTAKRRRRTSDSTARDEKFASATPVSSIIEDNNSSRELNGVDHRELGGRDTAAHDEEFDFFNDFHLSFSLVPTKPPIKVPTKSPTHRPTKPPTHRPTTPPSHSNIYDDDYYIPPKQERAYDDDAYYSNEHCDTIGKIRQVFKNSFVSFLFRNALVYFNCLLTVSCSFDSYQPISYAIQMGSNYYVRPWT